MCIRDRLYIQGYYFRRPARVAELEAEASSALARLAGKDLRTEEAFRYNVGMALIGLRDYPRAIASIERAAALSAEVYGARSHDAARGESGLCIAYIGQGDLSAAIPRCERAATMYREALGPSHPDTALAFLNLGAVAVGAERIELGCRYIDESYEVLRTTLAADHAQTLAAESNHARCLSDRGEHAAAAELLEHTVAVRERSLGPDHADVASALLRLGNAYVGLGAHVRARAILERALRVQAAANVDPAARAEAEVLLARALWDGVPGSRRDRERARGLARSASARLDTVERRGPRDERLREIVQRWLHDHG